MGEYDYRPTSVGHTEAETEREVEYLRERVDYLERLMEQCMCQLSCLEARVAELERRPVVVPPADSARRDTVGCYRTVEEAIKSLGLLERSTTAGKLEGELIITLNSMEAHRRA